MTIAQFKNTLAPAFFDRLTQDADGVTYNANGDYSATPAVWSFNYSANVEITQIWASIVDSGTFGYNDYASIAGGLPNGLVLRAQSEGELILDSLIQFNYDYQARATNFRLVEYQGQPNGAVVQFDYTSFGVAGIKLNKEKGDYINITFNDNLTQLIDHEFGVRGAFI